MSRSDHIVLQFVFDQLSVLRSYFCGIGSKKYIMSLNRNIILSLLIWQWRIKKKSNPFLLPTDRLISIICQFRCTFRKRKGDITTVALNHNKMSWMNGSNLCSVRYDSLLSFGAGLSALNIMKHGSRPATCVARQQVTKHQRGDGKKMAHGWTQSEPKPILKSGFSADMERVILPDCSHILNFCQITLHPRQQCY